MNRFLPAKTLFTFLIAFVLCVASNDSVAQTSVVLTRVAVTVENNQTSIWLTDFPKKATVVLVDADNNLLAVISTNEYGAAYTNLRKAVLSTVTAKTINGDIQASNKARSTEQQMTAGTVAGEVIRA